MRIPVSWLCVAGEVIPDVSKNCAAFIFKGMTLEDEGDPILRNVGKYLLSDNSVASQRTGIFIGTSPITLGLTYKDVHAS